MGGIPEKGTDLQFFKLIRICRELVYLISGSVTDGMCKTGLKSEQGTVDFVKITCFQNGIRSHK